MTDKKKKNIIEVSKESLTVTPAQRLFLLYHEFALEQRNNLSKYEKPRENFHTTQKEYFENFPFDEKAVRDFLQCKKELGYFKDHDVMADKLSDMLTYPTYSYGFRITNVTVGKGTHDSNMFGNKSYEVNEDEVYITYNTQQTLSGGKFTVVMQRKDGVNKFIKSYTHSRS